LKRRAKICPIKQINAIQASSQPNIQVPKHPNLQKENLPSTAERERESDRNLRLQKKAAIRQGILVS